MNSGLKSGFGTPKTLVETGAALIGYGTNSGGSVTQLTSKSTPVTLNKSNGQITMNAAALASGASVIMQLNNSVIQATSVVIVNPGPGSGIGYTATATVDVAGLALIRVTNVTGGPLSQAVKINFAVLSASAA